ncbi:MAG TPA: zinc ribbon domain-containing protein [Gemmataceae bacterium]|nr:zinc ribbon domain-containing protein [Gemmataceae bacterium]
MRLLVECPDCHRQYDATRRRVGSRFRCHCGHLVQVHRPEGHDARVVRCSACGATRTEGEPRCPYCDSEFTLHERDLNTVCPHCLARVSDQARFCHYCGTNLVPEHDAGADTKLLCPACQDGHRLVSRQIGDHVMVLECGRCAGFWMEHEVFRRQVELARSDALPAGTLMDSPQRVAARVGLPAGSVAGERGSFYRPCPVCRDLMNRRNYGQDSGVILDMCKEHGLWFDADELARVLAWVRAGGGREPTPAKGPSAQAFAIMQGQREPERPRGFFGTLLDLLCRPPEYL